MFVLSSVGIFFGLGEHVNFNTWWHMRVPVTDLMNSRGRGGECPPKTSNPFLGPCLWILVYKKPNFPSLFQTSEFRCLFLRPLWYEDTLSWTVDFATWNAHPLILLTPFNAMPILLWAPICSLSSYMHIPSVLRHKGQKIFFFHSLTSINASKWIQLSRCVQVQKSNYETLQMYISAQRETKQSKRQSVNFIPLFTFKLYSKFVLCWRSQPLYS